MKKLLTTALLALTAALTAGAQSRTEVYTFPSEVLGAEKSCTVYLPDGYDRSQESYPVLYLLHGARGCHTDWTQKGDLRRIADEAISAKLDRMEQVSGRIFKLIEEDEAKRDAAGTFLNYYLPTTLKLLENYASFEEAGVSGENLSQAKAKIEKTMDSIVAGFEHQLDELYRTDAMDIDSDIRVMETMLRRDTASVADDFGLNGSSAVQQPDE